MNTYFGYVLYSAILDKYDVGCTENLDRRIQQHNDGMSHFTSKANDWVLKYSCAFDSRNEALIWESSIKKKKSRKYIEFLIGSAG